MNVVQRGILTLIRSAITGEKLALPEDFYLEDAEKLIIRHQIVGLVYEGAVLCGVPKTEPVMGRLFQLYCQITFRSNAQMKAIKQIQDEFEKHGIDYMPVKGSEVKLLYPNPAMRIMTDADILIRMEQYETIRQIMQELGYTEGTIADHALVWNSKTIEIELHRRLVPSDEDYYSYIGEGWQRTVRQQGHRYAQTPEDMFVFLFAHLVKHYRRGGIGLRQVVDLWVCYRAYPQMDQKYLTQELESLKLTQFHDNIQQLLAVWFEDAPADEKAEFISQFIFDSGSWGTKEQKEAFLRFQQVQKSGSVRAGKLHTFVYMAFPPKCQMQRRYKVLHKAPWLLPFLWPVRWVTAALYRRSNVDKCKEKLDAVTEENANAFKQFLEYVGL